SGRGRLQGAFPLACVARNWCNNQSERVQVSGEVGAMAEGTYLSWDEVQRLALPPDATMLVPPQPEPAEVFAPAAGPPPPRPVWLEDAFVAQPIVPTAEPLDPAAARAAAERAEYGPGPVRFLANLIPFNALLEYA